MTEAVATELREYPRLAPTIVRAEVLCDGACRQGYLMNVSLGGAFLTVTDPPSPATPLEVSILLPWGVGECRLSARTVWLQTDEQGKAIGAGLAFVEVSEDAKAKLRVYLDRFVALAAEITR